jgi:hypothetical protein
MNKYGVRILMAVCGLAGLAVATLCQEVDRLVVDVPYDFVVAGKTLPAGTYRVSRLSDVDKKSLVLRGSKNQAVMVIPTEVEATASPARPGVRFQVLGNQHLLSTIETDQHIFTIPVSSPAPLEMAAKAQNHPSIASGTFDSK